MVAAAKAANRKLQRNLAFTFNACFFMMFESILSSLRLGVCRALQSGRA